MARGAKNEVTEDSRRIIDICRDLLKASSISIEEFFESSGLSNNYWYKRMRYEAPLNTSDVEHIASTFGLTSLDIYTRALNDDAARERESQLTDELIDRIVRSEEIDIDAWAERIKTEDSIKIR